MKIQHLIIIFCFFCTSLVFGEDGIDESSTVNAESSGSGPGFYTGAFVGLGPEMNLNSRKGIAAGAYISGGVEFLNHFALGLRVNYSTDFKTVSALEPAILFRYYMPLNGVFSGIFAELNAGVTSYFEYGNTYFAPLAALGAGWRFKFLKRWYVEPILRGGVPFTWGFGVCGGILF